MPGFCEVKLHHSQLSSTILREMNKFRQQGLFCDCTLVVQAQHFPVHKLILAAASEYFRALFTTNFIEGKSSQIAINGIQVHIFKEVLNFIYTNEITLHQMNITDIYTAADMFQLDYLQNLCHDYLINQLCETNCIGIWKYSKMIGNTRLKDTAEWYIVSHSAQVRECWEFKELMSSTEISNFVLHADLNSARTDHQQQQPLSLVVAGGFNAGMEKTCERYCEITDSWENTDWDLSGCKYFHWVGVIGLRLYAIGGNHLTQMNLVLSKLTERASEQLQTPAFSKDWECESTIPHDCSNMKFCVLNDTIYSCGPIMDDEFGICRYSPSDGSWEKITNGSDAKVFFQFFPHRNKLYILGGLLTMDESATSVFEFYDPHSNMWGTAADMTVPRYNFGVGLLGECLFAVGGIGRDDVMLNSVEMYSFETQKWIFVNSLPAPKASVVCNGWNEALYCFGGEMGDDYMRTNEVLKYSQPNDQWTKLSPLKAPRLHACSISL